MTMEPLGGRFGSANLDQFGSAKSVQTDENMYE